MNKSHAFTGRLALLGTAFIWGTSFVVLKSTLDSMGTMWVLAIRFTVSALLLALLSVKRLKNMSRGNFKGSILMGLVLAVAYIIQTFGLKYTTPGKNAFLTTTYCVLVPFLAWAVYKKKPTRENILAGVLCITGIGFVSLDSSLSGINIGDGLTLISGIFYTIQIIMMGHYVVGGDAMSISALQFASAALVCWAGALIFEPVPTAVPVSVWLSIGYLSIMCTAVCYYLQAWGLQYTPSSTAAVIMTFEAVFGALFSILFFGEELSIKLALGFVLIFVSVILSELRPESIKKLFRKTA